MGESGVLVRLGGIVALISAKVGSAGLGTRAYFAMLRWMESISNSVRGGSGVVWGGGIEWGAEWVFSNG